MAPPHHHLQLDRVVIDTPTPTASHHPDMTCVNPEQPSLDDQRVPFSVLVRLLGEKANRALF